MRLWSLHPKFLDSKGLVACWREGLLAKAVLEGKTRGYKQHPQLIRFKSHPDPVGAINQYLHYIYQEGNKRGYKFDWNKLSPTDHTYKLYLNRGQLRYEFQHLLKKIENRGNPKHARNLANIVKDRPEWLEANLLFEVTENNSIENWEKYREK